MEYHGKLGHVEPIQMILSTEHIVKLHNWSIFFVFTRFIKQFFVVYLEDRAVKKGSDDD